MFEFAKQQVEQCLCDCHSERMFSYCATILFICLIYKQFANVTALRKCCPNGEIIRATKMDYSTNSAICGPTSDDEIHAFNLRIPAEPNNFSQEYASCHVQYTPSLVRLSGCIDLFENQIISIDCPTRNEPFVRVLQMLKCCPRDQSYDLKARKCACALNKSTAMASIFGNETVVTFKIGAPQCNDEEEVFVEYYSYSRHRYHIEFVEDIIVIRHKDNPIEYLTAKSFCIDDILNANNQLIVRTCRPKDVCERITCVRRCCRNDQMFSE